MRKRVQSLPPTDVDDPLAEDRGVDQRLTPERPCNPVVALANLIDRLVPDERDLRGCESAEACVQDFELAALQIGDVARQVERHDLALAGWRDLVHRRIPFKDEAGASGT